MLPEDVRKAVERIDGAVHINPPRHTIFVGDKTDWQTIRAHLLAREAEVERLRGWRALVEEHNAACEGACDMDRCGYRPYFENNGRRCPECPHYNTIDIPAHLSENSRG